MTDSEVDAFSVATLLSKPYSLQAVVFDETETKIPSVRTEYHICDDGVKFHLWGDPDFPEDFGKKIRKALSAFQKDSVFIEYVSEVDSWYLKIKNISIGLNKNLVESLVGKIAAVVKNGG